MSDSNMGVSRSVSALFVYMLIGLFAVFSLLVVLIGAGAYQSVVRNGTRTTQMQTTLSYLASKVRAGDESGAVSVEEIDGVQVLCLRQAYEDEAAYTRIYHLARNDEEELEGGLYELFSEDGDEPSLESGQLIAEASAFEVSVHNGGIDMRVTTPAGDTQQMRLRLRSAQ